MSNFAEKVVVVTGGAQGIGKAIVQAFLREGAHVWIADADAEACTEVEGELGGAAGTVSAIAVDVGEEDDLTKFFKAVIAAERRIDVLVNNAGIGWIGTFDSRITADWDRVLNVNLRAPYLCAKLAVPQMPRGGAILNISSTRALMSEPNTESYAASKAGVLGLTHALAITLGDRGIRVNAISPGWIDVSHWRKSTERKPLVLSERDKLQHPAGRVGVPEDIAELCLYLCDSVRAGFITGQNFVVDGGMTKKMIYEE